MQHTIKHIIANIQIDVAGHYIDMQLKVLVVKSLAAEGLEPEGLSAEGLETEGLVTELPCNTQVMP